MFEVTQSYEKLAEHLRVDWDDDKWGCITIKDGDGVRKYYDKGEPEDKCFSRDYKWIKTELEKAYSSGYKEGYDEGLSPSG